LCDAAARVTACYNMFAVNDRDRFITFLPPGRFVAATAFTVGSRNCSIAPKNSKWHLSISTGSTNDI
jgi:predicted YcjX-like family ATPase